MAQNTTYLYNTSGWCQQQCAPMGKAVEGMSNGNECWCGDSVPPSSTKVDDSKCSTICPGYGIENCGADGYFSVYLTGTTTNVPDALSSSSSTHSASPKTSSTLSAVPSVVTVVNGGQTVFVTPTAAASTSTSTSTQKPSSGGGPNKAAIAAGVVVGIVIIAAIAGGAFLYLRQKRRREVEEEYRRNAAVSSFVNGGKPPTSSGGSSFTDTRLDPTVMAQRRMSDGSIADNQDYSRRILKVTNA